SHEMPPRYESFQRSGRRERKGRIERATASAGRGCRIATVVTAVVTAVVPVVVSCCCCCCGEDIPAAACDAPTTLRRPLPVAVGSGGGAEPSGRALTTSALLTWSGAGSEYRPTMW